MKLFYVFIICLGVLLTLKAQAEPNACKACYLNHCSDEALGEDFAKRYAFKHDKCGQCLVTMDCPEYILKPAPDKAETKSDRYKFFQCIVDMNELQGLQAKEDNPHLDLCYDESAKKSPKTQERCQKDRERKAALKQATKRCPQYTLGDLKASGVCQDYHDSLSDCIGTFSHDLWQYNREQKKLKQKGRSRSGN